MSEETTTVKADYDLFYHDQRGNPNEVILAALRYHKSIQLHNKLLEKGE